MTRRRVPAARPPVSLNQLNSALARDIDHAPARTHTLIAYCAAFPLIGAPPVCAARGAGAALRAAQRGQPDERRAKYEVVSAAGKRAPAPEAFE